MIFLLCTLAMGAIASTLWVVAIDGYGRIPDHSARDTRDRFSAAHHPRRDLGTS